MKAERFVLIGISALACSWLLFALSGLIWILSFPARLGRMPLSNLPLLACLDNIRVQLHCERLTNCVGDDIAGGSHHCHPGDFHRR